MCYMFDAKSLLMLFDAQYDFGSKLMLPLMEE